MNSEDQEIHQRGDSDDEIAELRFQALLTKKENEAEVSPARKPMPVDNTLNKGAINQPLSNFRGQPFNYRGRGGSHYYNKPYLQTFSQQIASKSVNSNNIVVLTSSDPDDLKPSFGSEWSASERGNYIARGAGWPRGGGRGAVHPTSTPSMAGTRHAPPLVLPQDKYASQPQNTQESEQNKLKLSARMRRLQGSDSDSEDSESDSSDDSSSNTSSSDSNSSSTDSSSTDSDSESDNSKVPSVKKSERTTKKVESGKHSVQATTEYSGGSSHNTNFHNHSPTKNLKSPVKSSSKQVQPSDSAKTFHSSSRSPLARRTVLSKASHSHSKSPTYIQKPKSPPPLRHRRSVSISPQPRRRSRSPLRRSRTPVRRYGSRSPPRYRGSNSPARNPKSPLGRHRSRSRSPYYEAKRFRSRSPYSIKTIKRAISPPLRRSSRSPLPPRRFSRSPVPGRLRSRSPKRYNSRSPRPVKRYGSLTPPPVGSYRLKSPYSRRRFGSRSPRPYLKRLSPGSPRRYRSISPRNARSPPFRKEILQKSPRLTRKSSFSPPVKRYGSRSPSFRNKEASVGNRSPLFKLRGRSPVGKMSSPQRIKRIGSLSPKPLLDTSDKFLRRRSPFKNFAHSPPAKRYGTPPPPPRRISPEFKMAKPLIDVLDSKDDMALSSLSFGRAISPRRHNYTNQSPSYFKNRMTPPGIQSGDRNFPTGSQSPVYYGGGMHMKVNRNIPYEKEIGQTGKRFPADHAPPPLWIPHKSEIALPPENQAFHRFPPKFIDAEYSERPGYVPQHPPPQLLEKPWQQGPPNRGLGHFGNGRGHPRLERLNEVAPPYMMMERGRGRGGRGRMRGQRGALRGVHARLGRGAWTSQHQTQPPLYNLPPPPFDNPYAKEKQFAMPPPILETEFAYVERKPQQFDIKPLPPLMHSQKSISPGRLQRVPRGPKTPPYSPNREPSPIEWEKRARANTKPRTPSHSPSPHRYGNEVSKSVLPHFKSRDHMEISDSRSHVENMGSHKPPPYRSRSPYVKDDQIFRAAHGHRMESKKEGSMRDSDDRKKIIRTKSEERNYKGKDIRKGYLNEDLGLISSDKLRERDRRIDERQRSPVQPRVKGSESYSSRNKDYETDMKKERDMRGRREAVEQKGRREHEDQRVRRETEEHIRRRVEEHRMKRDIEDERVRRESEDQKGRREKDDQRSRRESGDQRGRKEHNDVKNRKGEDHHKSRKADDERKDRREIDESRGMRENYDLSDNRKIVVDDSSKIKVKKEEEKDVKEGREKNNRGDEGLKKEKDNMFDRKNDSKEFDKPTNKTFDKHSDSRHRDSKRNNKDSYEHIKKDLKVTKEKITNKHGQEEKKKKKKKHKEEDRSSSKLSKKKKKEKKKKKDSKKQKKKSKELDDQDMIKKKKKSLDHSSSLSLGRPERNLRHVLDGSEESSRDKGNIKRKDPPYDADDRENRKRRKDNFVSPSRKDDWKWRGSGHGSGSGRDFDRKKEEREPILKERAKVFSSSDKRSSDSNRGGKGFFLTVNSGLDRHVSSSRDIGKKESGSKLPVHMRLGGKSRTEKAPVKTGGIGGGGGGMKGGKKDGQRMVENVGSLGRRKMGGGGGGSQQQSHRRQGMKSGMGTMKRTNR